MNDCTVVNYRFGDRYFVNEFVQPKSYSIQQTALSISGDKLTGIITFIRDGFQYPLDNKHNPSTDGRLVRYHKGLFESQFDVGQFYVWAFPAEVLISKFGYCAETANLATSLLRAVDIDAYTGIGEVRATDSDKLLGYHAWTIAKNELLLETTIHRLANTAITLEDAYNKVSSFATTGNIYYFEHARYNEKDYIGKTPMGQSGIIFQLLGKPLKLLNLYGLKDLSKVKPHKVHKEWLKEERAKHDTIHKAWSRL